MIDQHTNTGTRHTSTEVSITRKGIFNRPLKPAALKKGDRIAVIAPSGAVKQERANQTAEVLERLGFVPEVDEKITARRGYLAGDDDRSKANSLMKAFANPQIAGIFCARGGYGATRILEFIDWSVIKANPKVFCSFSDITALHLSIGYETGLVTFHGGPLPVPQDEAARDFNEQSFFQTTSKISKHCFVSPIENKVEALCSGKAQGTLEGGNLSLLAALCGTRWQPRFEDCILLVEDVGEEPYRIDRLLTQLLMTGALNGVRGIIFGDSPTCDVPESEEKLTLRQVIMDRLGVLGIPLVYGFPCGHTDYHATIPLGVEAFLDADAGTITLLETALVEGA